MTIRLTFPQSAAVFKIFKSNETVDCSQSLPKLFLKLQS